MYDGATALNLTPQVASPIAMLFVIISSPALTIEQPRLAGFGLEPFSQLKLITHPLLQISMSLKKLINTNGERRLMSIKQSQSCGKVFSTSPENMLPEKGSQIKARDKELTSTVDQHVKFSELLNNCLFKVKNLDIHCQIAFCNQCLGWIFSAYVFKFLNISSNQNYSCTVI